MDNFSKYLGIILLIMGVFFGGLIAIGLVILIFKLISVSLFDNRVSENIFHYIVKIIPDLIFFGAYYYLYRKIKQSKKIVPGIIASLLVIFGCLICVAVLICFTMIAFNVEQNWLETFDENSGYTLVMQLVIVFFSAMILAFGDPKEKDWLQKDTESIED